MAKTWQSSWNKLKFFCWSIMCKSLCHGVGNMEMVQIPGRAAKGEKWNLFKNRNVLLIIFDKYQSQSELLTFQVMYCKRWRFFTIWVGHDVFLDTLYIWNMDHNEDVLLLPLWLWYGTPNVFQSSNPMVMRYLGNSSGWIWISV